MQPSLPHRNPSHVGTKAPLVPPSQSMVQEVSTRRPARVESFFVGAVKFCELAKARRQSVLREPIELSEVSNTPRSMPPWSNIDSDGRGGKT